MLRCEALVAPLMACFPYFSRFENSSLRFKMLEVRELGNLGDHSISKSILQSSGPASDHRVPVADLLGQRLDVPLLPEVAFVGNLGQDAEFFGVIEEFHDGEMTPQEMLDAAEFRV